jgi:hypothetical protein
MTAAINYDSEESVPWGPSHSTPLALDLEAFSFDANDLDGLSDVRDAGNVPFCHFRPTHDLQIARP